MAPSEGAGQGAGPVRALTREDAAAFSEDLAHLDAEPTGRALHHGAFTDYQRASDCHRDANRVGDDIAHPDDVTRLTETICGQGWRGSRSLRTQAIA